MAQNCCEQGGGRTSRETVSRGRVSRGPLRLGR
jgi:hypothetical protein